MDMIFFACQLQDKYIEYCVAINHVFIDLPKSFDKVTSQSVGTVEFPDYIYAERTAYR